MLERVSLTENEAERRVRHYSLGMRQRLGIATALIGDPRVLILDEPANGLDPAGIRWMRDLLRSYADEGGTVLLSSHLLHEIEVIADDLVVIGNGRIVAQGTKAELLQAAGTVVRSRSTRDLAHALEVAGIEATVAPDGAVLTPADTERVGAGRPRRRHRPDRAEVGRQRRPGGDVPRAHRRHTTRRSSGMTATTMERVTATSAPDVRPIPMTRVVGVELRKMFDTRSGFWLMVSIVVTSVIATGAVIIFGTGQRPDLRQLRRGHRHPDVGDPADVADPRGHQRVEPAQRADHVHPGAAPGPGDRAPRRSPPRWSRSSRW